MARNPAGSGTIRKKTVTRNGKQYTYWEARYSFGRDPGTGRQIQKSITGKTQKEVARKLKEVTAAIDQGTYTAPQRITLAEWLHTWQETYLTGIKESTRSVYRRNIRLHIVPALGAVRLDQLDPHHIQRFINGLDLSPQTAKGVFNILHAALRQAVLLRYIQTNPADAVTLPKREHREMLVLDEDSTAAFLEALRGHPFELLYKVTLFTGLREGEILGLTWDRVDFKQGTILIDRQIQRGGTFTSTKNGKPRTITPPPYVFALLKSQKARQAEQRLKAGDLWQDRGLVFTKANGESIPTATVYYNFKAIAARIGLPDLRFHDLRHSYATAVLRAGGDIKTLSEALGHSSTAFTLDRYGHVTAQMQKVNADRMEAYINGILEG